jgi:hypothetical protein
MKVLGYSFNTEELILTMDKLKASALANMKNHPHFSNYKVDYAVINTNRVSYQFLKHILYQFHFLLCTRKWKWGEIEEEAWQLATELCMYNELETNHPRSE